MQDETKESSALPSEENTAVAGDISPYGSDDPAPAANDAASSGASGEASAAAEEPLSVKRKFFKACKFYLFLAAMSFSVPLCRFDGRRRAARHRVRHV